MDRNAGEAKLDRGNDFLHLLAMFIR